MASIANKNAVGIFGVNKGQERLELSMFWPEIKELCESSGKEPMFDFDKILVNNTFMVNIVSMLPITASCKVRGKTVAKVLPKTQTRCIDETGLSGVFLSSFNTPGIQRQRIKSLLN